MTFFRTMKLQINNIKQTIRGICALDYSSLMVLALWTALLSVLFQHAGSSLGPVFLHQISLPVIPIFMISLLGLYAIQEYRKFATVCFVGVMIFLALINWPSEANHSWFALWAIAPSLLFSQWWNEESYLKYLRLSVGALMIAAGVQKVVSGVYIDGSYITYLSHFGSTTEHLFAFLCNADDPLSPCVAHVFLGVFITLWQFVVGLLLVLGFKNWWILFIEVAFLLGAGLYADEMNFQVLNISILCIAFGYGMPIWLSITCILLLIIDVFSIGFFIEYFLL